MVQARAVKSLRRDAEGLAGGLGMDRDRAEGYLRMSSV